MRIKALAVLVLAAIATFAAGAKAQTVSSTTTTGIAGSIPMPDGMVHDITPFGQVDGKLNPEKITNDVAFRLLMNDLFVKSDAHPKGIVFEGLLNQIGLDQSDSDILRATVVSYNKNFDAIATVNNSTVGGSYTFWRDVYALVYNTRLGLNIQLSDEGNDVFSDYLQVHKKYLSVSPFDIGLGDAALNNIRELNMVASAAGGGMPQGMQMISNYSRSAYPVMNFPAVYVNASPFWSGWAQDTGSGNAPFINWNGQISVQNGPLNEANAYWPAGGSNTAGVSNMVLGVPPHYDSNNNYNSLGVRTNISSNGNNFYIAEFSGNGYVTLYSYRNNVYAWLGSWQLPSQLSATFQTNDQLTLITVGKHINVIYTPANAGNYSGAPIDIIDYYDSNPLPAGYVGIQECVCGGFGTFAGWTGGTGFSVTVSGSISGNTTGSGWPPSTRHTPRVVNTKGSLGGTITGGAVSPSTYVGITNQQTYPLDTLTAPDLDNIIVGAYVFCTQVGTFFQNSGTPFVDGSNTTGSSQGYGDWVPCWAPKPGDHFGGCGGDLNFVWLAVTYLHTLTFDVTHNSYTADLNCTTNTSPPDAVPPVTTIIQHWPYRVQNWRYYAVCVSQFTGIYSGKFSCEGIGVKTVPQPSYNPMPAPDLDIFEIVRGHKTAQYCTHHANTGAPL